MTHERLYNANDEKQGKIERRIAESIPSFTPFLYKCNYDPESKYKKYFRNNNNNNKHFKSNSIDSIITDKKKVYNSTEDERTNLLRLYKSRNVKHNKGIDFESRYRTALLNSQEDISIENNKANKIKSIYASEVTWQRQIDRASSTRNKNTNRDQGNNSLYKINVRDNSAWNKDKTNVIMYNPKYFCFIGKVI